MKDLPIKLKICGLREHDNIMDVARRSPDYMGFIFYRGSKRFVGDNFKIPKIPKSILRVGVFVNQSYAEMDSNAELHGLDFIQLHGGESPEVCQWLKSQNHKVIKVFSVGPGFDIEETDAFTGTADYFLFDTKGDKFGGNGTAFDWSIVANHNFNVPLFISGGISANNAPGIMKADISNLHALDVNSGVEISPGLKDLKLIDKLISQLK